MLKNLLLRTSYLWLLILGKNHTKNIFDSTTNIFFFFRFHGRRNYVLNSDSYGQSLLENYDDLDYSFDDEKALEDEEDFDVCEECHHQNNFLHEIDSIIKDPNELKNFRGCRRNTET